MKRLLIVAVTILLWAASSFAQTTVNLTVQDTPDNQTWNNGTWQVQLIPGPGNADQTRNFTLLSGGGSLASQSGSLSATGTASFSLPANANIGPSGTRWQFTVCSQQATACSIANITVTTSSPQSVTVSPPSIRVGAQPNLPPIVVYTTTEISSAAIGSQITVVGSTPATPTLQTCTAVSGSICTVWAAAGGGASPTPGSQTSFGATVSPLAYGAKWDGKMISDGATTSGSPTYTCPNTDCNFTSADLGKLFKSTIAPASATPPCSGASCGTILGQGFICVINSASSVNIGSTFPGCAAVNASATCATGANQNCNFAWATQDDSTAINNASTAAWNNGNNCLALELPSGIAFFSNPIFNVTVNQGSPCAGNGHVGNGPGFADFMQTGPVVYGQGDGATFLVAYNFPMNQCTNGASGVGCIGTTPSLVMHDFQITGLGESGNGTTNNVNLVELRGVFSACTSTGAYNMSFNNWMNASTGTQGFVVNGGCVALNVSNVVSQSFGNTNCVFNGQLVNISGVECFGSGGAGGTAIGTSITATQLNSTSSFFGNMNAAATSGETVALTGSGSIWNSFGDKVLAPSNGTNGFGVLLGAGTTAIFTGSNLTISNSSGAGQLFFCSGGSTCNIKAYGTVMQATGANAKLFNNAGTMNYFDSCGNTTASGAASSTINIFGSCSITGTAITAAKLVLSAGWGTTAAWSALSGTTQQVFGTITASGTGQAANPTITYTFPTPFIQTPTGCFALQIGGTQTAVANPFTPSALSATGVTFTYNGTPVAGNTLQVQIQCWNP